MSLRKWWRPVREVLVAVPMEIPRPAEKPGEDPAFLREMAESFKKCPVVYQNLNDMIKRRRAILEAAPPTSSQAARDAARWEKEKAATEAALLNDLFLAPRKCAEALNALANRRKAVESEEYSNWAAERIS